MFLFFLFLLRIFDDADQLFVLDILEGPSNREETLGVLIVDPVKAGDRVSCAPAGFASQVHRPL